MIGMDTCLLIGSTENNLLYLFLGFLAGVAATTFTFIAFTAPDESDVVDSIPRQPKVVDSNEEAETPPLIENDELEALLDKQLADRGLASFKSWKDERENLNAQIRELRKVSHQNNSGYALHTPSPPVEQLIPLAEEMEVIKKYHRIIGMTPEMANKMLDEKESGYYIRVLYKGINRIDEDAEFDENALGVRVNGTGVITEIIDVGGIDAQNRGAIKL